jgi:hypothetical protein
MIVTHEFKVLAVGMNEDKGATEAMSVICTATPSGISSIPGCLLGGGGWGGLPPSTKAAVQAGKRQSPAGASAVLAIASAAAPAGASAMLASASAVQPQVPQQQRP